MRYEGTDTTFVVKIFWLYDRKYLTLLSKHGTMIVTMEKGEL